MVSVDCLQLHFIQTGTAVLLTTDIISSEVAANFPMKVWGLPIDDLSSTFIWLWY